jgi:hypothetical protein
MLLGLGGCRAAGTQLAASFGRRRCGGLAWQPLSGKTTSPCNNGNVQSSLESSIRRLDKETVLMLQSVQVNLIL